MLSLPSAAMRGMPQASLSNGFHQSPLPEMPSAALDVRLQLSMKGSAMDRHPDFISSRKPPKAVTRLERLADLSGSALGVCAGALLAVGVTAAAAALLPLDLPDTPPSGCFGRKQPFRLAEADVAARLRAIQDLIALEVEIRTRLPKSQPGVIFPKEVLETYR